MCDWANTLGQVERCVFRAMTTTSLSQDTIRFGALAVLVTQNDSDPNYGLDVDHEICQQGQSLHGNDYAVPWRTATSMSIIGCMYLISISRFTNDQFLVARLERSLILPPLRKKA